MPPSNVQVLKKKFEGCICNQCKKQNCKLELLDFPDTKVIFDVDCIFKLPNHSKNYTGKRCDYIIVATEGNNTFFLPLEFKSHNVRSAEVKEQLKDSINYFRKYISGAVKYYPILVSESLKQIERSILGKTDVQCPDGKKEIYHTPCKKPLDWKELTKG